MEKAIIKGLSDDKITNIEVTATGHIMTDKQHLFDLPAILTIAQDESMPDRPVLSMTINNITMILEFNSDFPLLFKEGIKLYESNN